MKLKDGKQGARPYAANSKFCNVTRVKAFRDNKTPFLSFIETLGADNYCRELLSYIYTIEITIIVLVNNG